MIPIKHALLFIVTALTIASCGSSQESAETSESDADSKQDEVKEIGLQVYSLRKELSTDFEKTIKAVAEAGYSYIEGYGLQTDGMIMGMTAADYRAMTDKYNLEIASMHCGYFTSDDAESMLTHSKTLGLKQLIIPSLGNEQRKNYRAVAEEFNKIGEVFKGSGIKFGYHNHAFEFEKIDDDYALEVLIKNTNPELVHFQLDLYWVVKGGANPMELINNYPGRFISFHVKDADKDLNQTTVGKGIVDFESVFNSADKAGMEYFFVEDEREDSPIQNVKAAFDYLNKASFIK